MKIQLYDLCGEDEAARFSPPCWRIKYALHHKQLPFLAIPTTFARIKGIEDKKQSTLPVVNIDGNVIRDSWDIAVHLENTYPDNPTLFDGQGGFAAARFVEGWANSVLSRALLPLIIMGIHDRLGSEDQIYFRASREKRFGKKLEEVHCSDEAHIGSFRDTLLPMRQMLRKQSWIGGHAPLYADYIAFGTLKWGQMCADFNLFDEKDIVLDWYDRCLDLYQT
ncbi:MAG: glutathione S-transferase N-terminal domain-containing protein [Cohaesibacteraceae bacterium]|nr:glutathione S-transferase N-terminal domain-containing protein [Cohaesibacteraceae bacterium]